MDNLTNEADAMAALEGDIAQEIEGEGVNVAQETDSAAHEAAKAEIAEAPADNVDQNKVDESASQAEEADPEVEMVEWGEGDDAKSVPLQDLIDRYTQEPDYSNAPQVRAILSDYAEQQRQFSEQATAVLTETNKAREAVMAQMENQFALLDEPQPPQIELLNTNPAEYNKQLAIYNRDAQRRAEFIQQYKQLSEARDQDAAKLAEAERVQEQAYIQSELKSLNEAWPEFGQPETQKDITALAKEYGMTEQELGEIQDHRFFLMARDLLAVRKAQAQAGDTVEKLKAKTAARRVKPRQGAVGEVSAADALKTKIASGKAPTENEAMAALLEAI